MLPQWKLLSLYALSGLLLGIGFVLPLTWIFGFFGIAILLLAISKTDSLWTASLGGFISWLVKSLLATSLFWSVYPIKWIELELGRGEPVIIGIYWLTVSAFLATGGIVLSTLWWKIGSKLKFRYTLFCFPVLWIVSEVFSAWFFSVLTMGPGSVMNTVYSLGYAGYLLGNHGLLILLAKNGGVYALSFAAAIVGLTIFYLYGKLSKKIFFTSATLFFMVVWGSQIDTAFFMKANDTSTNSVSTVVAVVDTSFGDEFFTRTDRDFYKRTQITEAVEAALSLNPDYIILPEDSRFTGSDTSAELAYRYYRFWSSDTKTILVDSGRSPLPTGGASVRATIYDGITKKGWAVDKQYLVPQGEFFPYFYSVGLKLFGYKEAAQKINSWLEYRPGPLSVQADLPRNVPAVLFCFESVDPRGVRRLVNERPVPFVAHPISHAWFHESKILWQQQDVMLKVQALWSNVDIVSAGNMASGALYTKRGVKEQPTPKFRGEAWRVSVVSLSD